MWFKEQKATIIIIGVLLFFGIMIGLLFKGGTGSSSVKEKVQGGVAYIETPISKAANGLKSGFRGIFRFKEVTDENQRLSDEIKKLQQENAGLALEKEEYKELKDLSKVFNYKTVQYGDILAANIISVDNANWMHIFTIDKGTESGIKVGSVVLDGDGLAGKVLEVAHGSAKVLSILAEDSKISFQIDRDNTLMGVVQGDGKVGMSGYLFDGSANVKKGDVLLTSGIGLYPKGLKIGKVTEVEKNKGTQFINIKVEPNVSFNSLRKVAVIL